jgi:hypothetical protein
VSCSFGGLTGYVTERDSARQNPAISISYSEREYDNDGAMLILE